MSQTGSQEHAERVSIIRLSLTDPTLRRELTSLMAGFVLWRVDECRYSYGTEDLIHDALIFLTQSAPQAYPDYAGLDNARCILCHAVPPFKAGGAYVRDGNAIVLYCPDCALAMDCAGRILPEWTPPPYVKGWHRMDDYTTAAREERP
jgi:hypothetical protein